MIAAYHHNRDQGKRRSETWGLRRLGELPGALGGWLALGSPGKEEKSIGPYEEEKADEPGEKMEEVDVPDDEVHAEGGPKAGAAHDRT